MEEYQKRVVEEKKELDEKIIKLSQFIFSEKFIVPKGEQERMERQFFSMVEYSRCLRERIAAFI